MVSSKMSQQTTSSLYYKDFGDSDDDVVGISSNHLDIQVTNNNDLSSHHQCLSRSLPSLPSSPQASTLTTPIYASPNFNNNIIDSNNKSNPINTYNNNSLRKENSIGSFDSPPPIPPRSHKRYLSTSAIGTTDHHINNNSNNNLSTSPNRSPLLKSNSGTNLMANVGGSLKIEPLKNKLLKVITSVKNIPQVDSLLNLTLSSSPKNGSEVSSPSLSEPSSLSCSPINPSPIKAYQERELYPLIDTSIVEPNSNSNINSNSNSNSSSTINSSSSSISSSTFERIDSISSPLVPLTPIKQQQQQIIDNHSTEIEGLTFEIIEKDEEVVEKKEEQPQNQQFLTPIKSYSSKSAPPTPIGSSRISSPSLLHLSYKSNFLNQLSQQQSRSERSKFSLPILDISPYPKLSNDELNSISQASYPSLIEELQQVFKDQQTEQQNTLYRQTNNTIKDISLQKYKTLPPLPNQQQLTSNNSSSSSSNSSNNQRYGKLSSILQLISFSLPEIVSPRGGMGGSSAEIDATSGDDRYSDLTQYLNENGDRIKISQHIQWHLDQPIVNIDIVKLLGTHYGFPNNCRATSWMLMTGYLPANKDSRQSVLLNKRLQYRDLVRKYFGDQFKHINQEESDFERGTNKILNNVADLWSITSLGQSEKSKFKELLQQIHIDVIRTRPDGFYDLFELKEIEQMSERILAIWSSENTDVSYFQGLNDLICPFLIVFLHHAITLDNAETRPSRVTYPSLYPGQDEDSQFDLSTLIGDGVAVKQLVEQNRLDVLTTVECNVYYCLSGLLNSVKPYATNTGCGLPAEGMMKKLATLVKESNEELYQHFMKQNIDFSHFSFRWMVCFLIRDLSFETGIKLWDRYMCDKNNEGFSLLHISLCAALLSNWSAELLNMEFMELVQTLQKSDLMSTSQLDSVLRSAAIIKDAYRNTISL